MDGGVRSVEESERHRGEVLLGKLEVIARLGGGGMGTVYEVEHRLTGHRRALKVVHPRHADRPRFMRRLMREARVAGQLNTPYVAETFDAGRLEDGSAYVLMELLRGRTLFDAFEEDGPFGLRRLVTVMCQVTEGMSVAHAAGIVHRDLKPENIFLVAHEGEERVKILDFGVSKFQVGEDEPGRLTTEGTLVGTPYYMSPEQTSGKHVDARSDVYAIGVMMYEGLTGRLPYEADSLGALFIKIAAGDRIPLAMRRPDLPAPFCALVERAFDKSYELRIPNVETLRRALLGFLQGGVTAARAKTISDGPSRLSLPASSPHASAQGSRATAETLDATSDPGAWSEPDGDGTAPGAREPGPIATPGPSATKKAAAWNTSMLAVGAGAFLVGLIAAYFLFGAQPEPPGSAARASDTPSVAATAVLTQTTSEDRLPTPPPSSEATLAPSLEPARRSETGPGERARTGRDALSAPSAPMRRRSLPVRTVSPALAPPLGPGASRRPKRGRAQASPAEAAGLEANPYR